ncbi:MAG TPA: nucleotidyltransferase domain-containing protein [Geminicoccus sp.]|jgi:hypothetical protein|uniref:nucleotidyltransferase domain-containing protein n=1 Tax=Geminicoccus sp. TaxID=2024832 RepID=UPI002E2EE9A2|nr:nucleotidyltransferase domain-containing protein [Geminicoccus sp.]HEX2525793.1 nucleotidyltransferase domain-containing protein [Geminicoccus sp.]
MDHSIISRPKHKHFPLRPAFAKLDRLLQSCLAILLINWVFQGMRGMQGKELSFRLLFGLVVAGIAGSICWSAGAGPLLSPCMGLLVGHSANFLVNGQFWVCARYCPSYRGNADAVALATTGLAGRLARLAWLSEAAFIGSRARGGAPSDRSDIDLRLIFPPGPAAWRRMNLLVLQLRAWALWKHVPLDLYAYDRPDALRRFDQSEPLLIVKDDDGRLRDMFPMRCVPFGRSP